MGGGVRDTANGYRRVRVFEVAWPGAGRLAVVSRPSGQSLDIEMASLRDAGWDTLVSLLGAAEVTELGLAGEEAAAGRAGIQFHSCPVPDFSLPEGEGFSRALFRLHDHFRAGGAIAAHCRASVGRGPLLIASLMMLDGGSAEDVWRRISEARGVSVPDTDAQRAWIKGLPARPRLPGGRE